MTIEASSTLCICKLGNQNLLSCFPPGAVFCRLSLCVSWHMISLSATCFIPVIFASFQVLPLYISTSPSYIRSCVRAYPVSAEVRLIGDVAVGGGERSLALSPVKGGGAQVLHPLLRSCIHLRQSREEAGDWSWTRICRTGAFG